MMMDIAHARIFELMQERERDALAAQLPQRPGRVRLAVARRLHALAAYLETPPVAYTRPRSLSSR